MWANQGTRKDFYLILDIDLHNAIFVFMIESLLWPFHFPWLHTVELHKIQAYMRVRNTAKAATNDYFHLRITAGIQYCTQGDLHETDIFWNG